MLVNFARLVLNSVPQSLWFSLFLVTYSTLCIGPRYCSLLFYCHFCQKIGRIRVNRINCAPFIYCIDLFIGFSFYFWPHLWISCLQFMLDCIVLSFKFVHHLLTCNGWELIFSIWVPPSFLYNFVSETVNCIIRNLCWTVLQSASVQLAHSVWSWRF